jgi:hypothetical protein
VNIKNNLRGRVDAVDMLQVLTTGKVNFMLKNSDAWRVFCGQEMIYLKWEGSFLSM